MIKIADLLEVEWKAEEQRKKVQTFLAKAEIYMVSIARTSVCGEAIMPYDTYPELNDPILTRCVVDELRKEGFRAVVDDSEEGAPVLKIQWKAQREVRA